MSVTSMNSRMAMAEKLSIPQLQQAIKAGTVPAYVGIPLLQEKMKLQRAMQAQMGQEPQPEGTIADQIMQEADAEGITRLPSNLPLYDTEEMYGEMGEDREGQEYARGGIIALAKGEEVEDPYAVQDRENGSFAGRNPSGRPTPLGMTPEMLRRIRADKNPQEMEALSREAKEFEEAIINAPAPNIPVGVYNLANPGAVPPTLDVTTPQPAPAPTASPTGAAINEVDYSINEQEGTGTGIGRVAATPGARTAPTEPGIDKLPKGKATTAVPPTLKAAEKAADSDSPQSAPASQALSMLDKYVAMLEKSGQDVDRDKKEALYMALIQGGLAAAGGTSPNALANISAGMVPAMQGYQQALAGIKKDERARLEKLLSAGLKKEEFLLQAEKLGIERQKADNWLKVMTDKNLITASRGDGSSKEDRLIRQGYEKTGMEYDSLARRARADMATALKGDSEYTGAKQQLTFVKNLKPEEKIRLEKIVRDKEAPYLSQIQDLSNKSRYFMKQAGMDLSSSGGGKEGLDLNQFLK